MAYAGIRVRMTVAFHCLRLYHLYQLFASLHPCQVQWLHLCVSSCRAERWLCCILCQSVLLQQLRSWIVLMIDPTRVCETLADCARSNCRVLVIHEGNHADAAGPTCACTMASWVTSDDAPLAALVSYSGHSRPVANAVGLSQRWFSFNSWTSPSTKWEPTHRTQLCRPSCRHALHLTHSHATHHHSVPNAAPTPMQAAKAGAPPSAGPRTAAGHT
jgi:hypothetical protein